MILLKIISDLHLNRNDINSVKIDDITREQDSDVTVLAILGDVAAKWDELFKSVTKRFDYVLFVAGNHEYYDNSIQSRDRMLTQVCRRTGVIFLNRSTVIIDGVTFAGTTLWTSIPSHLTTTALDHLKEVKTIKNKSSKMSVSEYVTLHEKDVKWIERIIDTHSRVVVLTHHAPSFKLCRSCNDSDRNEDVNVYFASHLDILAKRAVLWGCGHIHDSLSVENMVLNATESPNYNPGLVIKIEKEMVNNTPDADEHMEG